MKEQGRPLLPLRARQGLTDDIDEVVEDQRRCAKQLSVWRVVSLVFFLLMVRSTSATLIAFDDLYVSGGIPVSNPYNGLIWTNFYPQATNWFNTPNGFVNACISGEDFAANGGGNPATISSGLFNLNGGFFAAGWRDNLKLQVKGFLNGTLLYSNTYTLSATSGTALSFGCSGVDTVVFHPPEAPNTLAIQATGLSLPWIISM